MITTTLGGAIRSALNELYQLQVNEDAIVLQQTKKEFEGDFTLVVFPYVKQSKNGPEQTAQEIGEKIKLICSSVEKFNVVKGFLNVSLSQSFWLEYFNQLLFTDQLGFKIVNEQSPLVLLEYSSPNTNKPLHLGHIRNHLLGYSVAELLKANGNRVHKTSITNDRGVHICKSMFAWQKTGNGETPENSGMKGDHLVGKYYVAFDKLYKSEVEQLVSGGNTKEDAEKNAPSMLAVQEMLRKWEAGDKEVIELWKTMNNWVYKGFEQTYSTLGIDFDSNYYESNTYLLGKEMVTEGLQKNVFYQKEDGSVWIDLTANGLDHKLVQRSDGTSVYITQDIGTAVLRYKNHPDVSKMIYTVGNEQDYHFKVLFLILDKLGYSWAKECYHLSYGMVELPEGKMKSREGTVVDADDLLQEMYDTAATTTKELGKIDDFTEQEANQLYRTISLGALKYFILKVDPKKKMLFDPKESIDFNGHTGPFIQYTYARIQSVLRKGDYLYPQNNSIKLSLHEREKELIKTIHHFPEVIEDAAKNYSPALVANYVYELAKNYNQFYHDVTILKEQDEHLRNFRMHLSFLCGRVISNSMKLLGIQVPNRM